MKRLAFIFFLGLISSKIIAQNIIAEVGFNNVISYKRSLIDSSFNLSLKNQELPINLNLYYKVNKKFAIGMKSSLVQNTFRNLTTRKDSNTFKYFRGIYNGENIIGIEPIILEKLMDYGFLKLYTSFGIPLSVNKNIKHVTYFYSQNYHEITIEQWPNIYNYGLSAGLHIAYPLSKKINLLFNIDGGISRTFQKGFYKSDASNSMGDTDNFRIHIQTNKATSTFYNYGVSVMYNL